MEQPNDSEVGGNSSNNQSTWHLTLLTSAILVIIASVAWFLYEPSFEPLIGLIGGVAGLMIYKRKVNRVFDSAMAIFLIVLFMAGAITIASSQNSQQSSSTQIADRLLTFAIVIGVAAIVVQILRWSIKNAETSEVAKHIAWALVGKADEKVVEAVLTYLSKLIVTMITWAILISAIWITSVLVITAIVFALGTQVSGTWDAIQGYGIFGLVVGAILGAMISLYRFHKQDLSEDQAA